MLDQATIDIIKATTPVVKAHADEITATFYPIMFKLYPEVIPYFNQTHQAQGSQPKALANAVVAYAANIEQLGNLGDTVTKIVRKHCALGILPEHYPIVGECLLKGIAEVLGEAATPEILDAWGKAYNQLADILIDAEEQVYHITETQKGGWRGEREFKLVKRVEESEVITSFYFAPVDGGDIVLYEAGQYLTIVLDIEGKSVRRNYSLSEAPGGDSLRISVKREPEGMVSGYLHDHLALGDVVKLLPPNGAFVLRNNDKPLVLVTGGVGITPAISMLNVAANTERDIRFIHAAINGRVHAFKAHVDAMVQGNKRISSLYVYSDPSEQCAPDAEGFITQELLASQLPEDRDVELYFLGPKPFMSAVYKMAGELGIPQAQVHYEFFGPEEELVA